MIGNFMMLTGEQLVQEPTSAWQINAANHLQHNNADPVHIRLVRVLHLAHVIRVRHARRQLFQLHSQPLGLWLRHQASQHWELCTTQQSALLPQCQAIADGDDSVQQVHGQLSAQFTKVNRLVSEISLIILDWNLVRF